MTDHPPTSTVGQLPTPERGASRIAAASTRLVWLLWAVSLCALAVTLWSGQRLSVAGLVTVDGLTLVLWTAVTSLSGVVHSYSRRYMAGSRTVDRFFVRLFGFTLIVLVLAAADNLALFWVAWLGMGLVMADLIGHVDEWPQARAAASIARRSFLAGSAAVAFAIALLWWQTGATTLSGLAAAAGTTSTIVALSAAGALLLAAMLQSALVPFHGWLLSSMTAPTPASALMHAGFVNAGGILLVRFAPIVGEVGWFATVIVLVGTASALLGKLAKTVQTDVKGELGCSTVGQMGFMILQVGLGFYAAAVTHLVLHGFYKAYRFLGSGSAVSHEGPHSASGTGSAGPVGLAVVVLTGLAGGGLFALLTGKGTALDSGLLLALLVVLTVLHAAREVVTQGSLPALVRYGAVPLVAIPAIAVYAATYRLISAAMSGAAPAAQAAELTVVHGLVAAAFLLAYAGLDRGVFRRSQRLYVALVNATRAPAETLVTDTGEYDAY